MNSTNSRSKWAQLGPPIYTHQLPFGVRRDICNLLDSDQSWRTLGGQFVGLDVTQVTLLGQAYLRNGSPTEELLNKLDSANTRISELCFYLRQMNHCRALELLKPYVIQQSHQDDGPGDGSALEASTLYTPTPSFQDAQPAALMGVEPFSTLDWLGGSAEQPPAAPDNNNHQQAGALELRQQPQPQPQHQHHYQYQQQQQQQQQQQHQQQQQQQHHHHQPPPPARCHKTGATNSDHHKPQQRAPEERAPDPGDEIVRLACANNRKRTSISDQEVVNQLRLIMQITYNELKQASNDFADSNILGNGGFASVYRGYWKGTDVAIKRLRCNLMDQALNELTILNSYRIDNILPIYGISIDGPEACLVYQFMANGSLEDRLSCKNDTRPLSWSQRAMIGEGVAKGLYYLHTLRDKPLVHGDVKSANVLLDAQFVPKLGDFGLARQVFKGKNPQAEQCTHCTVSSIHGTSVYLPPEYLRHKILSPAVDVYTYGIVLLEMATGRRAYDGKRLLIELVEDETARSSCMSQLEYSLKDPRTSQDTSQRGLKIWFELLIRLGLNCAHKIKKKRPDMGQVLNHFASFHSGAGPTAGATDAGQRTATPGANSSAAAGPALALAPLDAGLARPLEQRSPAPEVRTPPVGPNQVPLGERQRQPPVSMHSSGLMMSVDEECELVGGPQVGASSEGAVEAMIPLLTELGVVAQPD